MAWEQKFDEALETVRERVDAKGGISDEDIEQAIQRVRQRKRTRSASSHFPFSLIPV